MGWSEKDDLRDGEMVMYMDWDKARLDMPKGKSIFQPGNALCVSQLSCGKVLSGEPRFVKKNREIHAKVCQVCRGCRSMNLVKAEVAPEMTRTEIVRKTIAKSRVECRIVG